MADVTELLKILLAFIVDSLKPFAFRVAIFAISISLIVQVGLMTFFKEITQLQAVALAIIISTSIGFATFTVQTFTTKFPVTKNDRNKNLAWGSITGAVGGIIFVLVLILHYHEQSLPGNPFLYLLLHTLYPIVASLIVSAGAVCYRVYKPNHF